MSDADSGDRRTGKNSGSDQRDFLRGGQRYRLPVKEIFHLVADRERRIVLHYLRDQENNSATVDSVVDTVTEIEQEFDPDHTRGDTLISLHHNHLPKLVEMDLVEHDEVNGKQLLQVTIRGLKGGFIATGVMTVYRMPVFRALPPTAEFWARYFGDGEPEEFLLQGILLHFVYGTVAGGLFGLIVPVVDSRIPIKREYVGLVSGLCYGLLLSGFGTRIVFKYVIQKELDVRETLIFHVGHVIYGLTLGTWQGSHEQFGEVYEDNTDNRRSAES